MADWNNALFARLAQDYRSQLDTIMALWAARCTDEENGGYLTNFDEHWQLDGREKNTWAQARMCYMFGVMATLPGESRAKWLALAKQGRDFLTAHAYAGDGRWNYAFDEIGATVLEGATSVFTDCFALMALAQYAAASGSDADMACILETFGALAANIPNPAFRDIKPHPWQPHIVYHAPYMIAVGAAGTAAAVLGDETTGPFLRLCMDQVLRFFPNNDSGYLLESLDRDGAVVNTPNGRTVNPGHIFEGMWFCIDEAGRLGMEDEVLDTALSIIRHTADAALGENGGILHRFDCFGLATEGTIPTDTGDLYATDKVDWVNCEGLCALAYAAAKGGGEADIHRFLTQHEYCMKHFVSPDGEWYPLLEADGKVRRKNKGGRHRVAFHVPRTLWKMSRLFEAMAAD